MAFLGLKIDDDLTGQQAPLRYSPEAPTLVQAAGPGLELRKDLGGLGRKLSSIDGLLEFFVHDCLFSADFPRAARAKTVCASEPGVINCLPHARCHWLRRRHRANFRRASASTARSQWPGHDVREMVSILHGRGLQFVVILLCLPFLAPVSIPGISMPFGLAIALSGLRIAFGHRPWLPEFILNRPHLLFGAGEDGPFRMRDL